MKKSIPFLLAAMLAVTLSACGGGSTDSSSSPAVSLAQTGTVAERLPFTATVTSTKPVTITGESLTYQLTSVKDSRCPSDTTCIWTGQAVVTLTVTQPGFAPGTVTIGTLSQVAGDVPSIITYGPYKFTLKELTPGTSSKSTINLDQYQATVLVERI